MPHTASNAWTADRSRPHSPLGWVQLVFLWIGRALAAGLLLFCPWPYGMVSWSLQTWLVPWVAAILLCSLIAAPTARVINVFSGGLVLLLVAALLQTVVLPEGLWSATSAASAFERRIDHQADAFERMLSENSPPNPTGDRDDREELSDETEGEADEQEPATSESPYLAYPPKTLSVHPVQTSAAASVFAAAVAMVLASGILFRGPVGNLILLSTLGLTGIAHALLGIFQSVVWNNWTLLEMHTRSYFATFISRNSAPQSIAVTTGAVIGLLIWWAKVKNGDDATKRYHVRYPAVNVLARLRRRIEGLLLELDVVGVILLFAITLLFVATIAAASRGGIVACIFAIVATLGMTLGKRSNFFQSVGMVCVVGFAAVMLLTSLDLDDLALQRMDTISEEAYRLENGRITLWRMAFSEPAYFLAGSGLGTFHFAILPTYDSQGPWYYHAENIFVELYTELGVLGLLVGLLCTGWLISHLFSTADRPRRNELLFGSTVFAVAAVGMQSLVDFSLIIPAIFIPLGALVGCYLVDFKQTHRLRVGQTHHAIRTHRSERRPGRSPARSSSLPPHKTELSARGSRNGAHRETKQASVGPAWLLPLVSLLLLGGMFQGYDALGGFAIGSDLGFRIHHDEQASSSDDPDSESPSDRGLLTLAGSRGWVAPLVATRLETGALRAHPELLLQQSRAAQEELRDDLLDAPWWPDDTPSGLRQTLSNPETVAAALRGPEVGYLEPLYKLLQKSPQVTEQLESTALPMLVAAGACPLDWRASWGGLRADIGQYEKRVRARNYARLHLVTKRYPQLQEVIGTTALWANEKPIGLDFWQKALASNPRRVRRIEPLVGELLDVEDLDQVLPSDPLLRIRLAKRLAESRSENRQRVGRQLTEQFELEAVESLAETADDWQHLAWLAEYRGDMDLAIEAMTEATVAAPMSHPIRYRLARMLQSESRLDEAIEQVTKALRSDRSNARYKRLREQLQQQRLERPE
jgi:tetratricopeptide (TPR) repeat protein